MSFFDCFHSYISIIFRSRKKPNHANGAIHTKPQKHKRTPEKKAKQTDYDRGQHMTGWTTYIWEIYSNINENYFIGLIYLRGWLIKKNCKVSELSAQALIIACHNDTRKFQEKKNPHCRSVEVSTFLGGNIP